MRYILVILALLSFQVQAESINDCASLQGDNKHRCLAMATLDANQCNQMVNFTARVTCIFAVTKESRRIRNKN